MSEVTQDQPLSKRCRAAHPERITINGIELVREDIVAKRFSTTTRSLGRGDREGAPHVRIFGVKYRPIAEFEAWFLSQRMIRRTPSKRRARTRRGA